MKFKKNKTTQKRREFILARLSERYNGIGLVPVKVFEEQVGIIKTRDDLIPYYQNHGIID